MLLRIESQLIGVELETRVRDVQWLVRRMRERQSDGGADAILLVLSASAHNRRVLPELLEALGPEFANRCELCSARSEQGGLSRGRGCFCSECRELFVDVGVGRTRGCVLGGEGLLYGECLVEPAERAQRATDAPPRDPNLGSLALRKAGSERVFEHGQRVRVVAAVEGRPTEVVEQGRAPIAGTRIVGGRRQFECPAIERLLFFRGRDDRDHVQRVDREVLETGLAGGPECIIKERPRVVRRAARIGDAAHLEHRTDGQLERLGRHVGKDRASLLELALHPERPCDLRQQDVAVGPSGRIGGRSKSALRRSGIVEIPQEVDLRLVGALVAQGGTAYSGRKTKTSRMISAKSAVRYVIE